LFALSPIACTKYANYVVSIGKTHREDTFAHTAKTEMPIFNGAVEVIFRNHTRWVCKSKLRLGK